MNDGGFITLHRVMLESWLWRMSDGDRVLALTCLLMANWKPGKWFDGSKMVEVDRGSFITSAEKLAAKCGPGFTRKKVRGGLARLTAAEFLKLGTRQGQAWTLVTIENYGKYQDKSRSEGQVLAQAGAKCGPSEGQVRATIEQGNKGTREQSIPLAHPADAPSFDFESVYALYPRRVGKARGLKLCKSKVKSEAKYDMLVAAVADMAQTWRRATKDDLKFCPQFDTWISKDRWLDSEQIGPDGEARNPSRQRAGDFGDDS